MALVEEAEKVAIGDVDGFVRIIDLRSWTLAFENRIAEGSILWLAAFKGLLVAQERGQRPKTLDINGLKSIEIFPYDYEPHEGFCKGHCVSNEKFVTVAFAESKANVVMAKIDIESGRWRQNPQMLKRESDDGLLMALKVFTSGETTLKIILAFENGLIVLYQGVNVSELRLSRSLTPLALAFDVEKRFGIVCGTENFVISFSLSEEGELEESKVRSFECDCLISDVDVRSDGLIVALAASDGTIKLLSWKHPNKLKPLGALKFHSQGVESVNANAKRLGKSVLVSASKDNRISFWNIY